MSDTDASGVEQIARGAVRTALDRDLPEMDGEVHVDECQYRGCEQAFLGVTLEDYGVHLLTEHPRIMSQRRLYRALKEANESATETTGVDRRADE